MKLLMSMNKELTPLQAPKQVKQLSKQRQIWQRWPKKKRKIKKQKKKLKKPLKLKLDMFTKAQMKLWLLLVRS